MAFMKGMQPSFAAGEALSCPLGADGSRSTETGPGKLAGTFCPSSRGRGYQTAREPGYVGTAKHAAQRCALSPSSTPWSRPTWSSGHLYCRFL